MRLSEKTLELSICSQLAANLGRRVIWFGLTQRQEARAGFDACTRWGAQILILQFKASTHLRDGGATSRFSAPHRQMQALCARARGARQVFYVLPHLGTTEELSNNNDLLTQTWLLDASLLAPIQPPTTRRGTLRKGGEHHLDLAPPWVTVCSDPVKLGVVSLNSLAAEIGPASLPNLNQSLGDEIEGRAWPFSRKSLALAILPREALSRATR